MSYYCDICDKAIKFKSKKNHFKSLSHKEFIRCTHIKLTVKNPDLDKIDSIIYTYVIEHNKKYDNYLINYDFKLIFNNPNNHHISKLNHLITKEWFLGKNF